MISSHDLLHHDCTLTPILSISTPQVELVDTEGTVDTVTTEVSA